MEKSHNPKVAFSIQNERQTIYYRTTPLRFGRREMLTLDADDASKNKMQLIQTSLKLNYR